MLQDRAAQEAFELQFLAELGEGLWAVHPRCAGTPVELLERVGRVPLPPYIRGGEMQESDVERYQTVYARKHGAIAAPTAGLHFTAELLEALARDGIRICQLTLHVGVGTFRPVSATRLEEHRMHREWGELAQDTVDHILASRQAGRRVIAVGTTCARVLETASRSGTLTAWQGDTDLFIRPPFTFHCLDGLMTNFHLPRSTLLVLVRTFGGDRLMRRAYEVAVSENYRFFSYGDAMLIL
jgi:S-adenosylmethionine:tRNA ribosyltransferase-isomerase